MLQIFDSLYQTISRLAEQYGPKVALAVLALVACGIALRVVSRVTGGGAKEG